MPRPPTILGLLGRADVEDCHDGAAAIVCDGKILAALEQERVSGRRHAPGESAALAARVCLEQAGLGLEEIDYIAYGWQDTLDSTSLAGRPEIEAAPALLPRVLPETVLPWKEPPPLFIVRHHRAHLEASLRASGFLDAAGLILDGQGEHESISLFETRDDVPRRLRSYGIEFSLGAFYEAAAYYAGLGWDAAGKLMGLSSYGVPVQEIDLAIDPSSGDISLPPDVARLGSRVEGAEQVIRAWIDYFESRCYPFEIGAAGSVMRYRNFAASVQRKLEEVTSGLATYLHRATGSSRLVLGGGVALNCAMNRAIGDLALFEDFYIFPAAHDAGACVGAAWALDRHIRGTLPAPAVKGLRRADFGREFDAKAVGAALARLDVAGDRLCDDVLTDRAAGVLAAGGVVCWFDGRDEFGPRALGQRSLLADPRDRRSLRRLNLIKGREMWRPIGPSVQAERATDVFEEPVDPALGTFMLTVATYTRRARSVVPAVVHADGTGRPQLVDRAQQPLFWLLIERFRQRTGIPLVCNTSLNARGQPLIHTPSEAIRFFLGQPEVDALVIRPYFVAAQPR